MAINAGFQDFDDFMLWVWQQRDSKYQPFRCWIFHTKTQNMYIWFISFLGIDMTQVVEILPHVRQELTYST